MEKDELQLRNELAARLKSERERLRLSTDEMAAKVGVHRSTAFNYESGARVPDALFLHRLHRDVGIDIQYVVTGTRHQSIEGLSDADKTFIERTLALPVRLRNVVEEVALLAWMTHEPRSALPSYYAGGPDAPTGIAAHEPKPKFKAR